MGVSVGRGTDNHREMALRRGVRRIAGDPSELLVVAEVDGEVVATHTGFERPLG